jgi:hypothetical protein
MQCLPTVNHKPGRRTQNIEGSKTPLGRIDPFHVPAELADGLGVESLHQKADAGKFFNNFPHPAHRFAPADKREQHLHVADDAKNKNCPALGSPRRSSAERLRRSSAMNSRYDSAHVNQNIRFQDQKVKNFFAQ